MISPARRGALILLSTATLSACAVGPNFERPAPDLPARWSATAAASAARTGVTTAEPGDQAWWARFGDPELTSIVARAFAANLDLKQAVARIAEARATRDVAAAALWPQLSGDFGYTSTRLSETTPTGAVFTSLGTSFKIPGAPSVAFPNPYSQYQLGFDASWEIDLFGRTRRGVEAARADEQSVVAASQDLERSLAAEAAATYFDLRGAQMRRAVSVREIAAVRELAELARQRRAAGLSPQTDVANAEAQALTVEAGLPALNRQITQDVDALSRLIGREPEALRAELETARPLPAAPPAIPIGLPSDLARRRPDVREAEARLHAAVARVGEAKAGLYPSVTVGGPFGLQSQGLQKLTDWASRFYTLGPSLSVPVFEGGRLRGEVRLRDAQAKEAALAYRAAVLSAMHDVETALAACDADDRARATLQRTVAANRQARDLARDRYEAGLGSFIEVLAAQRSLLQTELALAQSSQAAAVDLAALYKALGGGWTA